MLSDPPGPQPDQPPDRPPDSPPNSPADAPDPGPGAPSVSTGAAPGRLTGPFLRYVAVGVSNSLLDLGLFTLLAVGVGLPPLLANVCSTSVTICVSYVLNRLFVFRTSRSVRGTVVTFVAVTLGSALVLQSAVIWAVIHLGRWLFPDLSGDLLAPAAKVCAMGVGMVSNFLGYRWLFRSR